VDTAGVATTYTYDGLRRSQQVNGRDLVKSKVTYYSGTNRVHKNIQIDSTGYELVVAERTYGAKGRVSQIRRKNTTGDEDTYYSYNELGQVTEVYGSGTYPIEYDYDDYGRRTEQIQYRNDLKTLESVVKWIYDDAENTGLMIQKRHYKTSSSYDDTDFDYNDLGQVSKRTWDRGVYTTYGYSNATGELLSETHSDATSDVTFTYDRMGRAKTIDDYTGLRTFDYSNHNGLTLKEEILPSFYYYDLDYEYHNTTTVDHVRGSLKNYSYGVGISDAIWEFNLDKTKGRLSSVVAAVDQQSSKSFSIGYDTDSNHVTSVTHGAYSTERVYESWRENRTYTNTKWGAATRAQFYWPNFDWQSQIADYRLADNGVDSLHDKYNASASEIKFSFTYDKRGQLTSFDRDDTGFDHDVSAYEYDNAGNITKFDFATKTDVTYSNYNHANQSTSNSLGYDGDGNLIDDALWDYTYDANNRLIAMDGKSGNNMDLRFYYDYMGRRVEKRVYVASILSDRVKFLYDGMTLIAELDSNGYIEKSFHWGPDKSDTIGGAGGAEGLIHIRDWSYSDNEGDFYPSYDMNGNLVGLLNGDTQKYEAWYEYDPNGNVVDSGGSYEDDNPFGFSTQYTDRETGLVYYGLRYYSPERGRFLNRDPIGEEGGANLYRFVGNNPVTNVDVWGLALVEDPCAWTSLRAEYDDNDGIPIFVGYTQVCESGLVWVDDGPISVVPDDGDSATGTTSGRWSKERCNGLAKAMNDLFEAVAGNINTLDTLSAMLEVMGGDPDIVDKLITTHSVLGTATGIIGGLETIRTYGTSEKIFSVGERGLEMKTPGGPRKFLKLIDPNGKTVNAVKAAGRFLGYTGVLMAGADAVKFEQEGNSARRNLAIADVSFGIAGLANPLAAIPSTGWFIGRGIGTYRAKSEMRNRILSQTRMIDKSMKIADEQLIQMSRLFNKHCK